MSMPDAVAVHPAPRRLPRRRSRIGRARHPAWPGLRRLLLGADGTALCWRSDERDLDRGDIFFRPD